MCAPSRASLVAVPPPEAAPEIDYDALTIKDITGIDRPSIAVAAAFQSIYSRRLDHAMKMLDAIPPNLELWPHYFVWAQRFNAMVAVCEDYQLQRVAAEELSTAAPTLQNLTIRGPVQ